jgi:hypothetical protein
LLHHGQEHDGLPAFIQVVVLAVLDDAHDAEERSLVGVRISGRELPPDPVEVRLRLPEGYAGPESSGYGEKSIATSGDPRSITG